MKPFFHFTLLLTFIGLSFSCQQIPSNDRITESRYYTDSLYSEQLNEFRKHDIFLPAGFDPAKQYPILYAADGQFGGADDYLKRTLDSLILAEVIPPMIYAGSHSNSKESKIGMGQDENGNTFAMQYRFFEYVESEDWGDVDPSLDQIFQRHMNYFTQEFIPTIEKEFSQEPEMKDRIFYGVSNGAGFGANLLNKQPEIIGNYILYSTVGSNANDNPWNADVTYPNLYLQYGSEEDDAFREESELLESKYMESNSFVDLKVYKGGHEERIWKVLLPQTLGDIYR
ncbi:alpha/beta hydrolase [Aureitalea marina]|uniref:Esterase n=1 Tax=Aureitalea marina TaxID=930804 RepID=A0A2S7KLU4_9FLAO|nr:alpha/beta hydrolase-fold protein [Aureitalea marina]PQB03543.1 hypothetical protein BST85_00500 [Aureitalea marina]